MEDSKPLSGRDIINCIRLNKKKEMYLFVKMIHKKKVLKIVFTEFNFKKLHKSDPLSIIHAYKEDYNYN